MLRRGAACLLGLSLLIGLCGCWNYKGMDQLTIVLGIALDYDEETEELVATFEVADLLGSSDDAIGGRLVESRGRTPLEAVRDAKRREQDELYMGSANLLIINHKLAEDRGILPLLEWFLRDVESRENMCVALSKEAGAAELLKRPEGMKGTMTMDIFDILEKDKSVTASTKDIHLYEIYNNLYSPKNSSFMAALSMVEADKGKVPELDGTAVFKGDKLKGYLDPEESKYALFIDDGIKGGLLTISGEYEGESYLMSLEILRNKTKKSYEHKEGDFSILIETCTQLVIEENPEQLDLTDQELIKQVEAEAERMIEEGSKKLVDKLKLELDCDAFGFGEMVYKKDFKLWERVKSRWDELYPELEVKVSSKVQVINTATVR